MTSRRWGRALEEHRQALDRYLSTIAALDDARWARERAPGAWSPALITQHLILYYQATARAARGELEMRFRIGAGWRMFSRWVVLPHILFHRSIPVKVRAPREVRPEGDPPERLAAVGELRASAREAEELLERVNGRRGFRIAHPYFGRLRPLHFLRLSAVHLDHHRRQAESTPTTG